MRVDPTYKSSEVQSGPSARRPAERWHGLLADAEMDQWQKVCESIEKLYADLERLANNGGDPQFQIFWANLEVLRPSVYSRAPVPVVAERFSDRRQIVRKSAEVVERALLTVTQESDMHDTLKLVRDDLALYARGVPWVTLDGNDIQFEHVDREDFRHDQARKWREVGWVAKRAYLSKEQVKELAPSLDEHDLEKLGFKERTGIAEIKGEIKSEVWEIWHKTEKKVIYVAENFPDIIKEIDPPVDLKDFFPCPRPAYGTLTPRKLTPVPDMVYYRDQLDEINRATKRISALTEMIKLKGFYDSSASGEMRQTIETAFYNTADNALIVGVPNLGKLLQGTGGQLIEWFPVEKAAEVVAQLVNIRRQLIDDVYQITGLSDIMRGATVASETATAQQLKAQYGGVRVRERQEEMVRIARDMYRIAAEMLSEKVKPDVLMDMAQITDLPKKADIARQVKELSKQAEEAAKQIAAQVDPNNPEAMAQAQQAMEQGAQQVSQQIQGLQGQMTWEDVTEFLRDEKMRPYALDVETDSTIQPNEDAEKQRRTEFLSAISASLGPMMQLIQADPAAGDFVAATLRFTANGFRAGRELQQPIDDFAERILERAKQPQGPSPEQQAAEAEAQAKAQAEQAEIALKQHEAQREDAKAQAEIALKQAQAAKTQAEAQRLGLETDMQGQGAADEQFNAALAEAGYAPPMAAIIGAA